MLVALSNCSSSPTDSSKASTKSVVEYCFQIFSRIEFKLNNYIESAETVSAIVLKISSNGDLNV
jgi:hypothetical protein